MWNIPMFRSHLFLDILKHWDFVTHCIAHPWFTSFTTLSKTFSDCVSAPACEDLQPMWLSHSGFKLRTYIQTSSPPSKNILSCMEKSSVWLCQGSQLWWEKSVTISKSPVVVIWLPCHSPAMCTILRNIQMQISHLVLSVKHQTKLTHTQSTACTHTRMSTELIQALITDRSGSNYNST
jgi:hypothetical protein